MRKRPLMAMAVILAAAMAAALGCDGPPPPHAPSQPADIQPPTHQVPTFEPCKLPVPLNPGKLNPFDPDEISIVVDGLDLKTDVAAKIVNLHLKEER